MNSKTSRQYLECFLASEHRIRRYIRTLVFHPADADDVFQETSLTMMEKFEDLPPDADFTAWSCRIAFFKVLRMRQKFARSRLVFTEETLQKLANDLASLTPSLNARGEALQDCMQRLATHERDLLSHRYVEGHTVDEIAQKTGRTIAAIYKSLSRTRECLRLCINRSLQGATR